MKRWTHPRVFPIPPASPVWISIAEAVRRLAPRERLLEGGTNDGDRGDDEDDGA